MRKKARKLLVHPLFAGSAVMIFGTNAVSFLNYIYHLFMGRLLGPEAYGELVALFSLIGLFTVLPGSVSLAIIKFVSASKSKKEIQHLIEWVKKISFSLGLFLAILALALSWVIANFLQLQSPMPLFWLALIFFFSIPLGFLRAVLQGLLKFTATILTLLIDSGLKLALGIVLIRAGFALNGALAAMLISVLLAWLLASYFLRRSSMGGQAEGYDWRPMLKYTFPVMLYSVSSVSLYSTDVILVKHFFNPIESGLYGALSMLAKIIFFGAGPVAGVMFPLISKKSSQGLLYKRVFAYGFLLTLAISAGILFFYWQFPKLAIKMLYGSAYLAGSALLVWLGLFLFLFTLSSYLANYFLSLNKTWVAAMTAVSALIQIIGIWYFHTSIFEVVRISIFSTGLLLLGLLIYYFQSGKTG